jgi:hypothetical protein
VQVSEENWKLGSEVLESMSQPYVTVEPSGVMLPATLLLPFATTSSPLTGLVSSRGRGRGVAQGAPEWDRISTGCPLRLVNESSCGRLASETASAPKSNSGVEG